MLTSKKTSLKTILESTEGLHLTIYLVNNGDLVDLKTQLRNMIYQSYEWLSPIMNTEERNKFLDPLDALLLDARIIKEMKGNIGIFRNRESFRVLNVPVKVEQTCQVATSFHVKPLLRWLQNDQEFLLLGLERGSVNLYLGSQDTLKHLGGRLSPLDNFEGLNNWISQLTKTTKPKLFLAGEKHLVEGINQNLKYSNAVKTPVSNSFDQQSISEITQTVRNILKVDSERLLEKVLLEFRFAEEGNRAQKNIFLIAKAVVRGRVRKLIVTDELSIFGTIDKMSGGIAIHPCDLDHEDDDILDDLAQMVLSQGGEVVIAGRDEIPNGRPILAILNDEGDELEKLEGLEYEFLR